MKPTRSALLALALTLSLTGCFGGSDDSDDDLPPAAAYVCTAGTAEDFYFPVKSEIVGDWAVGGTPASYLSLSGNESFEKIDVFPGCNGLACDEHVVTQTGTWKIQNALLLLDYDGSKPDPVGGMPVSSPDLLYILQDCGSGELRVVEQTDMGLELKYTKS